MPSRTASSSPRPRPRQLPLGLKQWGGRRKGAGRKPKGWRPGDPRPKPGVPHTARPAVPARCPVHVTLRVTGDVWNLRSRRSFAVLSEAFAAGKDQPGFRVVGFTVMGNHVHVLGEAQDRRSLGRGVQGLEIRAARGLNRLMGRQGRVFADRYHVHVLRTPTEVARAVGYVLGNFQRHHRERRPVPAGWQDPYSRFGGDPLHAGEQPALVVAPRTWLLRSSGRRAPAESG